MKKVIFTAALFLGLSQLGNAQNTMSFTLDDDICITEFTAHYESSDKDVFALGCEGDYKFSTGEQKVAYFTINGVDVYVGEATEIPVQGKKKKKATVKVVNVGNTIVDDLNGLIR